MAYEEVAARGEKSFGLGGTYKDKKTGKRFYNPIEVEGYFHGTRLIDSKMNPGKKDPVHTFEGVVRDRTGKTIFTGFFDVWGKTDLNRKLASCKLKFKTKATFTGMQPEEQVKIGKKPMYLFAVYQDPKDVLSDADIPDTSSPEEEPDTDEAPADEAPAAEAEEFEEEAALDADDAPADEVQAAPAKKPAAAKTPPANRQAEMQRLMGAKTKSA